MKKQAIHIEHDLHSRSANVIWNLLSSAEGLAIWIADEVQREGNKLVLTWGEVWNHHEVRKATVNSYMRNDYIRYVWKDDTDKKAYWELKIVRSEITGDYILIITDFAEEDDQETLYDLWETNLDRLHHATGL